MLGPRYALLHNGQLGSSLISFHHSRLQITLTHTRLLNKLRKLAGQIGNLTGKLIRPLTLLQPLSPFTFGCGFGLGE